MFLSKCSFILEARLQLLFDSSLIRSCDFFALNIQGFKLMKEKGFSLRCCPPKTLGPMPEIEPMPEIVEELDYRSNKMVPREEATSCLFRLEKYQSIVRRRPSLKLTFGSQPKSCLAKELSETRL